MVTNNTYQLCPWADALFAMDRKWWTKYLPMVREAFAGLLFTASPSVKSKYVRLLPPPNGKKSSFGNSGACALLAAMEGGATRIIMLGYDCQKTGGKAHWHANHPAGFGNAGSVNRWPEQFSRIAAIARAKGVSIVNASRVTALNCFDKADLEEALQ